MDLIEWDVDNREYSTGIDMVALYLTGKAPTPWEGVTAINESPSGAESNKLYANNVEYLNLLSKEEFGFTIEAYCSPEAFNACDGMETIGTGSKVKIHGRKREKFAIAYRVLLGNENEMADNDVTTTNCEYHVVYGCRSGVASNDHSTINESPEAGNFSWEISTEPEALTAEEKSTYSLRETAHIIIRCNGMTPTKLDALQAALYGKTITGIPSVSSIVTALQTQEPTDEE